MADNQSGDQPAPGAEQRITKERDELREKVADLEAQVKASGVQVHAQRWLAQRGITEGGAMDQWLQAMTPTFPNLQFESTDQIAGLLDANFGQIVPNLVSTETTEGGQQPPPSPPQEPATSPSPPAPAVVNPQPGGGIPTQHQPEPLVPGSQEWNDLLATQGMKGLERFARESGRPIAWTSDQGRFPTAQHTRQTG